MVKQLRWDIFGLQQERGLLYIMQYLNHLKYCTYKNELLLLKGHRKINRIKKIRKSLMRIYTIKNLPSLGM